MTTKLAAAAAATEATAIALASEQINNLRAESQKNDAVNFEVQRRLNQRLALLSGSEHERAKRLQDLAATCQDLRDTEAQLRDALAAELARNAELVEALEDQVRFVVVVVVVVFRARARVADRIIDR